MFELQDLWNPAGRGKGSPDEDREPASPDQNLMIPQDLRYKARDWWGSGPTIPKCQRR